MCEFTPSPPATPSRVHRAGESIAEGTSGGRRRIPICRSPERTLAAGACGERLIFQRANYFFFFRQPEMHPLWYVGGGRGGCAPPHFSPPKASRSSRHGMLPEIGNKHAFLQPSPPTPVLPYALLQRSVPKGAREIVALCSE